MEKITVGMPITDASAGEINTVSIFAQQPPIFRISRYKIGKQVNERSFIFIKKPTSCQEKNRPHSSVNLLSLSNINMVLFQVLDYFLINPKTENRHFHTRRLDNSEVSS